jgi:hypothetical protein
MKVDTSIASRPRKTCMPLSTPGGTAAIDQFIVFKYLNFNY